MVALLTNLAELEICNKCSIGAELEQAILVMEEEGVNRDILMVSLKAEHGFSAALTAAAFPLTPSQFVGVMRKVACVHGSVI